MATSESTDVAIVVFPGRASEGGDAREGSGASEPSLRSLDADDEGACDRSHVMAESSSEGVPQRSERARRIPPPDVRATAADRLMMKLIFVFN